MDSAKTWGEAITISLLKMGQELISFLPKLLGAFIIIFIGWVIAGILGGLVTRMVFGLGLDRAVEKLGFRSKTSSRSVYFSPSVVIGGATKWFLVLVFLMAASSILELEQVTIFLSSIVAYLPNVFVATIILIFVFLLGDFVYHIIKSGAKTTGVVSATLLATISKWAIMLFGIFAALIQLGIASFLVDIIFIGMVAMFSLAGGLAFGLGGKEEAQLILRKLREEFTGMRK